MKIPALRTVRRAVAAVALVWALALFVDFPGVLPAKWTAAIAEIQFVPSALRALAGLGLAGFVLWIAVTLAAGRIYCSSVCPLGIFQDVVWHVRRRIFPTHLKFSRPQNTLRFAILLAVVCACAGGWWLLLSLLDPYSIFGRISAGVIRPSVIALNNLLVPLAGAAGVHAMFRATVPPVFTISAALALASLVVVGALAAWRGRIFCNAICPVGCFLGVLSKRAAFRLEISKSLCEKCGECLYACKAQCIDLKAQEIDFSRCVACFDCVAACDRSGIGFRPTWTRPSGPPARLSGRPTDPVLRRTLLAAALLPLAAPAAALAKKAEAHGPEKRGKRHGEDDADGDDGHRGKHGGKQGSAPPAMPPGAVSLDRFLDRCTACGLCVANCPTQVLKPAFLEYGWRGFLKPRLDPEAGFCNYDCTVCIAICPTGALEKLPVGVKRRTQLGKAEFHKGHCVVHTDGTDCAACSEHCPTKAVDTVPYRGNLLLPKVDESLCIGCGACEFACPVRPKRAIRVRGQNIQITLNPPPRPEPAAAPAGQKNDFPF
jgi:ferredoxin